MATEKLKLKESINQSNGYTILSTVEPALHCPRVGSECGAVQDKGTHGWSNHAEGLQYLFIQIMFNILPTGTRSWKPYAGVAGLVCP